jgi:hypothetical protein
MNKPTKYVLAFLPSVLGVVIMAVLNPSWLAGNDWWMKGAFMVLMLGTFSGVALWIVDPDDRR